MMNRRWVSIVFPSVLLGLLNVSASRGADAVNVPIVDITQEAAAPTPAPTHQSSPQWYNGPLMQQSESSDSVVLASNDQSSNGLPAPTASPVVSDEGSALTSTVNSSTHNAQQDLPPVVNLNTSTPTQQVKGVPSQSLQKTVNQPAQWGHLSMSEAKRLAILEKKVDNLTVMNMPQSIADMQMKMQQLSGQLEVLQHDLDLLNKQQSTFYKDLDTRIQHIQNASGGNVSISPSQNKSSSSTSKIKSSEASSDAKQTTSELKDANAYRAAMALLSQKKYDESIAAFRSYLKQFPNGQFAVNAHYWLGELYTVQQQNTLALTEFTTVIASYPTSSKVPDSKYKVAVLHAAMGKQSQAVSELKAVQKQYPQSTAAQLAKIKLQQWDING